MNSSTPQIASQAKAPNYRLWSTIAIGAATILATITYNLAKTAIRNRVVSGDENVAGKTESENAEGNVIKKSDLQNQRPIERQPEQKAKPQVNPQSRNNNTEQIINGSKNNNGAMNNNSPKIVGKLDSNMIEKNNNKKKRILETINQLQKQHNAIISKSGYHNGQNLRNEIALLKASLYYV